MKIDFYISSLSAGGAERVLSIIAKSLSERENQVTVISLEKRPQFYAIDDRVTLIKYKCKNKGIREMVEDYQHVRHRYKTSDADISISFLSRCNILLLLCSIITRSKRVVSDRNNPLKEHSKLVFLLCNILYKRADKVIVQTEQIKSFYPRSLQKKIRVIENPIEKNLLESQLQGLVPEREKVIVSIGRLEPQKDFKTLVDAAKLVSKKYPEWKVKIFGDGSKKKELLEYIDNEGLSEFVFLYGRTELPFYELSKASIFVLSSFYEGFPNVLCEAMCAGNLCISSDCVSGPKELIEHDRNGWLFQIGDANTLAKQIINCIKNERELNIIRTNAQDTVKRLDIKSNINHWETMIKEVATIDIAERL